METTHVPEDVPANPTTDPAVIALIERARKDEKDKLYAQIQKLENQLENQLEELQKARTAPADPQPAPQLEAQVRALERQLAIVEERHAALITQEKNARAKLELDLYTERKIGELRAAGTGFIPRLVTGNSPAEIDAAITESVKIYAEIHTSGAVDAEAKLKGAPLAAGTSSGPRGTVTTPPSSPGDGSDGDISAEAIASMSTQDWAKAREGLLQKAGKRT